MPMTAKDLVAAANALVPRIPAQEAMELARTGNVLFVDVRDAMEVASSGKVPGAVHVSRGLIEFRACTQAPTHDKAFDPAKTVVVYCASGGRSALAGKTLKDLGYADVRNLGGFKEWVEAGGPVEKS